MADTLQGVILSFIYLFFHLIRYEILTENTISVTEHDQYFIWLDENWEYAVSHQSLR